MKNIFSKISSLALAAIMMITMFGFSSLASAGQQLPGWNTAYYDCPTLSVVNVTTGAGMQTNQYQCWTSQSVSANQVGDVINVTLFFHNSTGVSADNVSAKIIEGTLTGPRNVGIAGDIYASGTLAASDIVYVNIPANTKLTYVKSIVGFPKNSGRDRDLGGSRSIFSGLSIGSLQSTDADQGYVKLKYVLESTGPTGSAPVVNTQSASVSGSSATLNGDVSTGNLSTEAWFDLFEGSSCSTNGTSTGLRSVGTNGSGNYSTPVNNLSAGTYSYRAVAKNSAGQVEATQCKTFVINGGGTGGSNIVAPSVTTQSVTLVNNTSGSAILNGTYNTGNDDDAIIAFEIYNNEGTYTARTVGVDYPYAGTGSFSEEVYGLPNGTYQYRAIIANNVAEKKGEWVTFTINRGGTNNSCTNGATNYPSCNSCASGYTYSYSSNTCIYNGNNNQNISITTNSVSGVTTSGSARLNGYYNVNTPGRLAFEIWRESGGYNQTFVVRNINSGSGDYTYDLSGLSDGVYTYRAYFIPDSGSEVKAGTTQFTINRASNNYCSNGATNYPTCTFTTTYTIPTAQVLNPVTINAYQTTLGGYYTTGSCSGQTWFEYGPTTNLGSRTAAISRAANAAGNTSQTIYGLTPSTTYYYRVISQNCQNTVVSTDTRSFTTTRPTIIDNITRVVTPRQTNTVTQTVTTTAAARTTVVGGTGVKYLRLNIDNEQTTVTRGDSVTYDVQWENISDNVTLNDLVLEVTFPEELRIADSSRGDIDKSANAVYLNIDRLDPREEGRMTVTTRMNGTLALGAPVVGRAIMAFENPTLQGAQENAIAYDSDRYDANGSSNVLGASVFGAGFLPGTLAGWLIIFLIIILIILAARHYMRSGYNGYDDRDRNDGPYTPYRPQA